MINYYILDDGHDPIAVSAYEWSQWFENIEHRRVAEDYLFDSKIRVSTVFLGLNHQHWLDGPPLFFETMVFGGETDMLQTRYSTWDDAVAGHQAVVELVKACETPTDTDNALHTHSQSQVG
ncbi:hypothetical protein [Dendronalium sp. ChiSLP03b]|uniref:hypothetical protein n=1 Tax=Dendronalium sp. ChiSLP03b TaxID=3075381 RepID=UPI00391A7981